MSFLQLLLKGLHRQLVPIFSCGWRASPCVLHVWTCPGTLLQQLHGAAGFG